MDTDDECVAIDTYLAPVMVSIVMCCYGIASV